MNRQVINQEKIPFQIWILTLATFAIGTAEFVIAGILPQISRALTITEGQAGYLISAYAMAIVIGGPILTIYLARFNKKSVLIGLMILFIIGNILSVFATSYHYLLVTRIISGLTQGPFFGISTVVATNLVSKNMAGRAVGQMFAGLTLANVLGVPAGTWIGLQFGWHITFLTVAIFGIISLIAIISLIKLTKEQKVTSILDQLRAFKNPTLLASIAITTLVWSGFMTLYGYIAPLAIHITGYSEYAVTWLLVIVGFGLLVGNILGARSADKNLNKASLFWAVALILSLMLVGLVISNQILFPIALFIFGVAAFANVSALQLRVMKHAGDAQELAATANISAFNLANAFGGILGGVILDSQINTATIPYFAVIVPMIGLLFIIKVNNKNKTQINKLEKTLSN